TPRIRSGGKNPRPRKRSASSCVRISLVTIATSFPFCCKYGTNRSIKAVFPDPTGPPIPRRGTLIEVFTDVPFPIDNVRDNCQRERRENCSFLRCPLRCASKKPSFLGSTQRSLANFSISNVSFCESIQAEYSPLSTERYQRYFFLLSRFKANGSSS